MTKWNNAIIWIISLSCIINLLFSSYYFFTNVEWFKASAFDPRIDVVNTGEYRTYIFHLQLRLMIRSVGLLTGSSIMMLGMASIFYLWTKDTKVDAEHENLKLSLVSASPGLLAILIGGIVLIATINSKDTFPAFPTQVYEEAESDSTETSTETLPLPNSENDKP